MDSTNQQKLLNAGFIIIRREINQQLGRKIKYKSSQQREWATLEKDFKSDAAVDRRMKELLIHPLTVED